MTKNIQRKECAKAINLINFATKKVFLTNFTIDDDNDGDGDDDDGDGDDDDGGDDGEDGDDDLLYEETLTPKRVM